MVNGERIARKQDPCHVPRKSSGPSPVSLFQKSRQGSPLLPSEDLGGGGGQPAQGELFLLIIKPQLTTPDPVDPRRSEIAISTPAGPRTGPGDTDKHERIQEIVIRGIWGLLILPNKVLLFCVRRDYPRKLNDLNIYPGLFSVKL